MRRSPTVPRTLRPKRAAKTARTSAIAASRASTRTFDASPSTRISARAEAEWAAMRSGNKIACTKNVRTRNRFPPRGRPTVTTLRRLSKPRCQVLARTGQSVMSAVESASGGEAESICSRRALQVMTDAVDKVVDDLGEALCLNVRGSALERWRGRPTLDGRWTLRMLTQRTRPDCSAVAARCGSPAS
jgi:hypothetical protein